MSLFFKLLCILVAIVIATVPCCSAGRRLNEYVVHYDVLDYDHEQVSKQHERSRRSTSGSSHIDVTFSSHQRPFRLRLKRDTSVFHEDLRIVGHDGRDVGVDTSHLYQGHLIDEPSSVVYGSVRDGVFDGKIHSINGTFYVERASKYFGADEDAPRDFHSVIYKDENVVDPYENIRSRKGGCGVDHDAAAWMDSVQHSAVDPPEEDYRENRRESPGFKYSKAANQEDQESIGRSKRSLPRPDKRSTCSLFIQTDPLLWKHVYESEKRNAETTRKEITSMIAQHVNAVNQIYTNTMFDGKYQHRAYRFEVQRIKIDDYEACEPHYAGEENKFCLPNIDVSNYLNLHSQGNHSDFCLAYVFTYRDFTGGTLGLAWVASPSGASGGVCERHKTYTENIAGFPRSTRRSLNTGIITFVNYNSRVPPKVSQLTLAHEIGHNFGSPHDFPTYCRPGGQNGNFIMFASATSGERPNNSKFSNCSVANISAVLDSMQEGKKRNCFTEWKGAFCGNKIVEEDEECDCGYDDRECEEKCCYPRIVSEEDKRRDPAAEGCKRRPNTQCSPSQGQCCTNECRFVPQSARKQCKEDAECSGAAFCSGTAATCPPAPNKPDGTECNGKTQVCQKGECAGSICLKWGMRECFLTSNIIEDKRKLCELACLPNTVNATCRGTSELTSITGLPEGVSLRPGSPCDNFQGYCDVFLKCRAVDAEGPLARLKNLLFNKETLQTIAQWITEYWWAVLLIGVGFIIFMGIFIKCCAVHTPSSNPRKPPALSFSETLRHPYSTLRRQRRGQQRPVGPQRGYGEGRDPYTRQSYGYPGQRATSYEMQNRV